MVSSWLSLSFSSSTSDNKDSFVVVVDSLAVCDCVFRVVLGICGFDLGGFDVRGFDFVGFDIEDLAIGGGINQRFIWYVWIHKSWPRIWRYNIARTSFTFRWLIHFVQYYFFISRNVLFLPDFIISLYYARESVIAKITFEVSRIFCLQRLTNWSGPSLAGVLGVL